MRQKQTARHLRPVVDSDPGPVPEPEDSPEARADAIAPKVFPIRLILAYQLDGQPVVNSVFQFEEVPLLPDGQIATLTLKLDTRTLLTALEPHLGPLPGSAQPKQGPALILPGYLQNGRGRSRND